MWIDQSTRRKDGPEWVCAGCGERWPRRLLGTPFPHDRCNGCGGELVTAPGEPDLTSELDAAEAIAMGGTRADIPPAATEIISSDDIHLRRNPDGSAEIATACLGGPSITLAPFEWRALCDVIRRLDRGEEVPGDPA